MRIEILSLLTTLMISAPAKGARLAGDRCELGDGSLAQVIFKASALGLSAKVAELVETNPTLANVFGEFRGHHAKRFSLIDGPPILDALYAFARTHWSDITSCSFGQECTPSCEPNMSAQQSYLGVLRALAARTDPGATFRRTTGGKTSGGSVMNEICVAARYDSDQLVPVVAILRARGGNMTTPDCSALSSELSQGAH